MIENQYYLNGFRDAAVLINRSILREEDRAKFYLNIVKEDIQNGDKFLHSYFRGRADGFLSAFS